MNRVAQVGDLVRYSTDWLRATGQYTGDVCFVEGIVASLITLHSTVLALVMWNIPDFPNKVNVKNLEVMS